MASFLARHEMRVALGQLAEAMPELSERERRRIARRMFIHLGRCAAEATHLERFVAGAAAVRLDDATRRTLDEALAPGRGAIAVTGHIGNWELLAQVVAQAGYPATTIARPLYDPRRTRWVHKERTRRGLEVIRRGDEAAGRDIPRALEQAT